MSKLIVIGAGIVEVSAKFRRPGGSLRAAVLFYALLALAACVSHPRVSTPPRPAPDDATWLTGSGDVRLYTSIERPEGAARCIVYVVPGAEVGSEPPYPRLSKAARARGFVLVTLHARGTGYSDGLRGDIRDYEVFLGDQRFGLDYTRARFAGRPTFLLGHSAGAALALELAANTGQALAGLLLVNPAYKLRRSEGLSPSFGDLVRFAFNAVFRPAALTVDMNRDPGVMKFAPDREEGEAMQRDPLVVRYFSLRMMSAQRRVMRRAPRNAGAVDAPVLLIQGAHDALVDPRGNDEILAAAHTSDKQRLVSPSGGHGSSAVETMVEPILEWLEQHCPPVSP